MFHLDLGFWEPTFVTILTSDNTPNSLESSLWFQIRITETVVVEFQKEEEEEREQVGGEKRYTPMIIDAFSFSR